MVRFAVFCPRFTKEREDDHKQRRDACMRLMRAKYPHAPSLHTDTLEDLMFFHMRNRFRRVIVARAGFYDLEFHAWARRHGVEVVDALDSDLALAVPAWMEAMRRQ